VDPGFGIGRAQTVCVFDGPDGGAGGLPRIAVDVDADRFRELLLSPSYPYRLIVHTTATTRPTR
jgi:hypothetical protein